MEGVREVPWGLKSEHGAPAHSTFWGAQVSCHPGERGGWRKLISQRTGGSIVLVPLVSCLRYPAISAGLPIRQEPEEFRDSEPVGTRR